MQRNFWLIGLTTVLTVVGCVEDPPSHSTRGGTEFAVDSLRQQYELPAMAAAVIRTDTVISLSATGVRRKGRAAKVSVKDWFHLGSNTKAMTSTLIALLVEDEELSWSTTPSDVFSGKASSFHPEFRTVTLEQLLAHRAGLEAFTNGSEFRELPDWEGTPKERRASFTAYLLQREPAYEPGSTFVYSNAGYTVATAMAEQVSGISWEQLMRQRLFEPLGITGGFGWPAASDSNQPWGHREQEEDTLQSHNPNGDYQLGALLAPAGDAYMSIGDYARFLRLHLRGLAGKDTDLLDPSSIRYIHKSRGSIADSAGAPGYGLGWAVQELLDVRTSLHSGSAGTFIAKAAIQPTRNIAVAVLTNAGNEKADVATSVALDSLLKRRGKRTVE